MGLAAVIFALAANALSPRGLSLTRDYFPGGQGGAVVPNPFAGTNAGPFQPDHGAEARLAARGLKALAHAGAVQLFQDPRYAHGLIVFLDARNEAQYLAGHIPGAHQFDHYRAPQYLPAVLPVCLAAERVVVYCGGGECEDSEFAAIILRDAGVPGEKLAVYATGFQSWEQGGLPVELGLRNSGNLRPSSK